MNAIKPIHLSDTLAADAATWMHLTGATPFKAVDHALNKRRVKKETVDRTVIIKKAFELLPPDEHPLVQKAADVMTAKLLTGTSRTAAFAIASSECGIVLHEQEFPFCVAKAIKDLVRSVEE
jgi:hypothetical protein